MKMEESPLEVLSRAVSIVQNENKAKKRHSAPPMASSDSGIEDDLTTECSAHSPRRSVSLTLKSSPRRDYDSDDSSARKSPRLFNAVKCFRKSSPLDTKSKHHLSPRQMSPRQMSPRQMSPRQPSPRQLSPRDVSEYEGYPHYSPRKDITEREQRSPERMDSDRYPRYEVDECKRRSPERPVYAEEKHLKKIKVEEPEHVYESGLPVLNHCSEGKRMSPKHGIEPRIIPKPTVPVLNMTTNERSPVHHVVPRYMHTYPPYPPLFILTDKPTNYSKLMETYDSIFAPKPPVHPPPLPAYTKCNCGDKNCLIITPPPVCSPPPPYREKTETTEYGLPNVDEHFRKSLGEKYDIIKCEQANERPSSVDDHFAKALGQKWFKMEYGKKCTSTKT